MNTHHAWRRTGSAIAFALLLLTLTSWSARASDPGTAAHAFSSHPMISGTVVTVNDHQMVVHTDQGEQVTLELDSRTMAPRDLGPGMVMRAEFLALEDCRFYARRVVPVRGGESTKRTQAYANTRDTDPAMPHGAMATGMPPMAEGHEHSVHTASDVAPGAMMHATPGTADHAFSRHPMMSGCVLAVNDHRVIVHTDQGQQVGLVMDSRTLVPREVTIGSVVRAEFTRLKDGRYYANRISRIEDSGADREQAYAHTRDSDLVIASSPADCGFTDVAPGEAMSSTMDQPAEPMTARAVAAEPAAAVASEHPETLPQTAGSQPSLLLLALIAVGAAVFVVGMRGLRAGVRGLQTAVRGLWTG